MINLYNPNVKEGRVAIGEKSFKVVGHVARIPDNVAEEILKAPGWVPFTGQVEYPGDSAFREKDKD